MDLLGDPQVVGDGGCVLKALGLYQHHLQLGGRPDIDHLVGAAVIVVGGSAVTAVSAAGGTTMLTPQEVSERAFQKASFGGYNMAQVDEFLDILTGESSSS